MSFLRPLLGVALAGALALPAGQIPERDRRITEIRHTDFRFDPPEFPNRRVWNERSAFLRKQILAAAGLLPLPKRTPLNAEVFGKIEGPDYTIEKVLIETRPGSFLGGNLYRPKDKPGPFPVVASPHGHWSYGRLEHGELGSIPARGINLAKQGYVVFAYDMIGYGDTRQLPHDFLGGPREEMWGIGLLGEQLWNSIRAVDFLESLADVDRKRIGATGASGGGSQTFLLSAVDDRVAFSAPVNMVSLSMQGGSVCENAPNLRIETNNVELAALSAPRPMLVVSATGDWTREVPQREGPALEAVYKLLNRPTALEIVQFDAPHNYHRGSREAVYRFFGKHALGETDETRLAEQNFRPPDPATMLALWGRTLPDGAVDKRQFVEQRIDEARREIESLKPRDAASLDRAREAFRERLGYATMAFEPAPNELASDLVEALPNGEKVVVGRRGKGERIPAVLLRPARPRAGLPATLVIHPEGSAWALASSASREGFVAKLLAAGGSVAAIDAFQTGRAVAARNIAGAGRSAEKFFTTFNRTDTANRVLDVLIALTYARTRMGSYAEPIRLVCFAEAGLWCGLARALASGPLDMAADLGGFDASDDAAFVDRLFVPHLRKAGDFRAAATLWTGGRALLWNAAPGFPRDWAEASFEAAGRMADLRIAAEPPGDAAILEWMGVVAR